MQKKKTISPVVNFSIVEEHLDGNGIWNPHDKASPFKGGLQVNVFGTREHYLKLAEFFRKFAEQDTSDDGDFHEHFEGLMSVDDNTRLHVILRKDDVGDSTYGSYFPRETGKKIIKTKNE